MAKSIGRENDVTRPLLAEKRTECLQAFVPDFTESRFERADEEKTIYSSGFGVSEANSPIDGLLPL